MMTFLPTALRKAKVSALGCYQQLKGEYTPESGGLLIGWMTDGRMVYPVTLSGVVRGDYIVDNGGLEHEHLTHLVIRLIDAEGRETGLVDERALSDYYTATKQYLEYRGAPRLIRRDMPQ